MLQIIQRGNGSPLVFIPGLQGRWEYAQITVDALSSRFRVITFSLCDEPSSGAPCDRARGIDAYADQVAAALDIAGCQRAIVCGLSFGGRVALRFAAKCPQRVEQLVLASTPGPGWRLRGRHALYARMPRLLGPLFLAETPFRARAELKAALPAVRDRVAFGRAMLGVMMRAPLSLARMAARARLIESADAAADCVAVSAPTLVITGEAHLDRVVPVAGTQQYARLIRRAEHATLERSGHQGSLTRPRAFVSIVSDFIERTHHAAA